MLLVDYGLIYGYGTNNCPVMCPEAVQSCCDQVQGMNPMCCLDEWYSFSEDGMVGCQEQYDLCYWEQVNNPACGDCQPGGLEGSDKKCCGIDGGEMLWDSEEGYDCYINNDLCEDFNEDGVIKDWLGDGYCDDGNWGPNFM